MGFMDANNGFNFEKEILAVGKKTAKAKGKPGSGGFIIPVEFSTYIIKETNLLDALIAYSTTGKLEKDQLDYLIECYRRDQNHIKELQAKLKKERTSKKWYKDRYKKR